MTNVHIPGYGRKRPQLNLPIERLFLDTENPRLPENVQGKSELELLNVIYKEFNLEELADSMAKNGYFDEEPLVAIPRKLPSRISVGDLNSEKFLNYIRNEKTEFTVVEGNRRLATVKLLLDLNLQKKQGIKHWPSLTEEVANDLRVLPVIIYRKRSEVVPYLGIRHIIGIQKWYSYAKARYINKMIDQGLQVNEVEAQIGDKAGSIIRNLVCYKLLEQVEDEFDLDTSQAKKEFSLLLLSIGQGNIKKFLGLPKKLIEANLKQPVSDENTLNLKMLLSWIYGEGEKTPVIKDSRDITNFLSHVVSNPDAIAYLENSRDLPGAYDRTDGEEKMIIRYLTLANLKLEVALGIAHRHKTSEVLAEAEKCENTVKALLNTIRDTND